MRRTLLLTLLLLLVPSAAAGAATTYVVRGAGFGHGIGMSQYGAYGYAKKGWDHDRILAHYYSGTEIGSAGSRRVRVLLQASDPYVRIKGALSGFGKRLSPGTTYKVSRVGGRLRVSAGSRRLGTYSTRIRFKGGKRGLRLTGRAINGLSSGRYRGSMEARPGAAGGVTAINDVPIDSYVRGVVPAEMPASWSLEALKAQAVAARSYALATDKGGLFDQYPDTRSQVYRGIAAETSASNRAVSETRRQIVTYNGEVATTFFFSTSGGRTENIENSFIGSEPQPYLRSVKDPYDGLSPKHRWRFRFSASQLDARLGAPGRLRKVKVLKRGRSPRIVRARVYGSSGSRTLTGPQIRARLGLYDSWAYFTKVSASASRKRGSAARSASAGRRISGTVSPTPAARTVVVQRRSGKRWVRVTTTRTSAAGRYVAAVDRPGRYRVRVGSIVGPTLRVDG